MKKTSVIILGVILVIFFVFSLSHQVQAQDNYFCAIYFTGIGCPHCAKTDPVIFENLLKKYPNLIIIEYEIYQQRDNAPLLYEYDSEYKSGLGVPLIILGKNEKLLGDREIINSFDKTIAQKKNNPCLLLDNQVADFESLDLVSLPGRPKIWQGEKILVKQGIKGNNELLKNLLTNKNLVEVLKNIQFQKTDPLKIQLSSKSIGFSQAIKIDDWLFQWNGQEINGSTPSTDEKNQNNNKPVKVNLTLAKIISLALADSLNPCAFAVLVLMLVAILTYNPTKRKNLFLAGFYFVLAVFSMYFLYGLVIIKFFQLIQALTSIRLILYKILGGLAILLGILNIKDFVYYRPGGFLTEMPMFIRPTVKKLILGITSPTGAFLVGIFVTIFLLPCTIGPYIICGGILCSFDLIKTVPYLLLYNFIFVLPMIIIVLIVYFSLTKVEDISGWKDKNIKYLHLIAGLIILGLGLAMILGWV